MSSASPHASGADELAWLRSEVTAAAGAFADQLRSIDDTSTPVPGLDWTVADLGQHLVSLPDFYRAQNLSTEPWVRPDDFAAFSNGVRAHVTATDANELADAVQGAAAAMLNDVGEDLDAPHHIYGLTTTARNHAGGLLGELIIHGMDLAKITGAKVTLNTRQANAVLGQFMTLAPAFVDQHKARKLDGTYHIGFRGGDDYTYEINDGVLTVSKSRPAKADARLKADPATFTLVSLGRMNQYTPALTGKIIAYGRKPWRLMALGNITVDGV